MYVLTLLAVPLPVPVPVPLAFVLPMVVIPPPCCGICKWMIIHSHIGHVCTVIAVSSAGAGAVGICAGAYGFCSEQL